MATQTVGAWMGDQFTSLLIGIVLGSLILTLIYGVIRKTKENWWIWDTGVAVAFLMFVNLIAPVYLSPLFNDYKALEDSPLQASTTICCTHIFRGSRSGNGP